MGSWSKLIPEEPETIYTSDAVEASELLAEFGVFVQEVADRADADGVPKYSMLFCVCDATNGFVRVHWVAEDDVDTVVGEWEYTFKVPALHEASTKHPEGAFHFDQQLHDAMESGIEDHDWPDVIYVLQMTGGTVEF